MRFWTLAVVMALLSACASYSGSGLIPGKAGLEDVLKTMGEPAMRWQDPDGAVQLSYPRSPAGTESFMVNIDGKGKLKSIRNVINQENFAMIKPGMSKEEVLRILGPSVAYLTAYYPARDELALDWLCEIHSDTAHFIVLFDKSKNTVRSSMILIDQPPSMN